MKFILWIFCSQFFYVLIYYSVFLITFIVPITEVSRIVDSDIHRREKLQCMRISSTRRLDLKMIHLYTTFYFSVSLYEHLELFDSNKVVGFRFILLVIFGNIKTIHIHREILIDMFIRWKEYQFPDMFWRKQLHQFHILISYISLYKFNCWFLSKIASYSWVQYDVLSSWFSLFLFLLLSLFFSFYLWNSMPFSDYK